MTASLAKENQKFLSRHTGVTVELCSKSSIVHFEAANCPIGGNIGTSFSFPFPFHFVNSGGCNEERYLSSLGRHKGEVLRPNRVGAGTGRCTAAEESFGVIGGRAECDPASVVLSSATELTAVTLAASESTDRLTNFVAVSSDLRVETSG